MTRSIGFGQKECLMAQEISIFHLSTGNLYLRDITFVIDVSVSTIETIKLVFKLVFLKQFISCYGCLNDDFEIGVKGTSAKKVTLRDANEDVDKVCIEVQKLFTTQVENLHVVSH